MQLVRAASRAMTLVLLPFSLSVHGQSIDANQNITLRFFQNSAADSCAYSNSSAALTFTTESIPIISRCFDFADLFSGNATQGFVNQTGNLAPGTIGEAGIRWQLENVDKFDTQANYSRVLYRQHITNPANDDDKPRHYADRRVTVYGGKGCTEKDPSSNETLLPWYGFSCWSEDEGTCGTLPYSIASFSVQPGPDDKNKDGTCWVFAERGAAAHLSLSSQAMMAVFASTSLAIWLCR
ncbi:hypothetical protein BCR34DRAFT_556887 [Clohesyomyces aquaticus]|uniref:Uncharacterized protein n=1 Tax=Clohesyomyces aquaticus TaxID=1231657 RepID=A0A1Y2A2G6_9PLEO|nr:hypothetical protein BCR34DRAFT_556887 [Clohesyomyces aquaticus]